VRRGPVRGRRLVTAAARPALRRARLARPRAPGAAGFLEPRIDGRPTRDEEARARAAVASGREPPLGVRERGVDPCVLGLRGQRPQLVAGRPERRQRDIR
jgi:hypothetical protein